MPNRLARSTSPYLRQHADNPVSWYEWGPEALARARSEDKPILLSVGYSACHWCHVMAHESFEDEAIAELMNEHFVCIKVDREERPDLDAIYQRVVQLMGQGGGWPLTVFLTPDQQPFYGGTYFPPRPGHGRPSFRQVLGAIGTLYRDEPDKVAEHCRSFMEGFAQLSTLVDDEAAEASDAQEPSDPAALRLAVERLLTRIDPELGGFGRQPKFPNPTALELLAAVARRGGDDPVVTDARRALLHTLESMYRGGIYDHLRGGFARYSTDRQQRFAAAAAAQPMGYASLLHAARFAAPEAIHVTVRGPSVDDPQVQALARRTRSQRLHLPQALSLSLAIDDVVGAVVCRGQVCRPPVRDVEALRGELSG